MQNMAAGLATEDSILMLQAHHVDIVEVQEFSRFLIGSCVVLGQGPSHSWGIVISLFRVVYRQGQQSSSSIFRGYCRAQVGRECSNPTLSRKIISDHRDSSRQGWLRLQPWASH